MVVKHGGRGPGHLSRWPKAASGASLSALTATESDGSTVTVGLFAIEGDGTSVAVGAFAIESDGTSVALA